MKTQDGKFILFDVMEFAAWLDGSSFGRVIRLIQNHPTWKPSYANFHRTNHFELLQSMEAAHIERGFSEIAQNLTSEAHRFGGAEPGSRAREQHANGRSKTELREMS